MTQRKLALLLAISTFSIALAALAAGWTWDLTLP